MSQFKQISSNLKQNGWKITYNEQHFGISFDIKAYKKFGFTKWDILIKHLKSFNKDALNEWRLNFTIISDKSKSFFIGRCFILSLIVDEISLDSNDDITLLSESYGAFSSLRAQGGGGTILFANNSTKEVYGIVPNFPLDVRKYTTFMKKTLEDSFI